MHSERLISNPLIFIDGKDFVIIGKNRVDKTIYLANKEKFDLIISTGDVAWNEILNQKDITRFLVELGKRKALFKESILTLSSKECKDVK